MATARSIEVKVGILILTAVGLLAVFIVVMGGINFEPTYSVNVDFDNPGGLQKGAPVKIAGVKVGKISDISFLGGSQNAKTGKRDALVRMKVDLEKRYEKSVHENSIFYVTTQGVLGEQFLAIEPGSDDRPLLAAGSTVRALDPPRLDMLMAEMYELLHSTVTTLREHREEIGDAFAGLKKTVKGTGEFFEKNGTALDRIVANVEKITVDADDTMLAAKSKYVDNPQIARILENTENITDTVSKQAPPLIADAKATLESTKKITEMIGAPEQQAKIKQAVSDVAEITSRAKGMTADAEAIVKQMRRGKGTVGALVMDEQLYDDLQELARDLKHNPWKFLWRE